MSYVVLDAHQMQMIETAFKEYHRRTCIRFQPRGSERDYISIVNGNSGCWSSVGRIGGKQVSMTIDFVFFFVTKLMSLVHFRMTNHWRAF